MRSREDDVLLLPQIAQWCRDDEGLRHCTLLLTPAGRVVTGANAGAGAEVAALPFPEGPGADLAEIEALENACVIRSRLSPLVLAEAFGRMVKPCRTVVSGPGGFNSAAREMLLALVDDEDDITVLSA
jgi:hypothetical protein